MEIRYTFVRIIRNGTLVASFDTRNEPSLYIGILNAIANDLRFTAYSEHDFITRAEVYIYDGVRHWIVELTEDENDV